MIRCLIASLIISLGLALVPAVHAQEAAPAPSASEPIFERERLEAQINEVTTTYRAQFATYRETERQYQVAKTQFQQLGTLTALEAAVKATQQAQAARVTVLSTYITLIKLELINTTGISVVYKDALLKTLDAELQTLSEHAALVARSSNREEVAQSADAFDKLLPDLENVSYLTQTLIASGRLQSVYDGLVNVRDMVQANAASAGAQASPEKERALSETSRTLDLVHQLLQEAQTKFADKANDQSGKSLFTSLNRDFNDIFAGLSQVIAFIEEVRRL